MSYVKIWIHAVWTTKNRMPILLANNRQALFSHIHHNGITKGILMETVNGHKDHVHCLFRLKNDQTIMRVLQLLKGESSFWANQNVLFSEKLTWQKEYYAISVGESLVPRVRNYIQNQEEHHKKVTLNQEYQELISKYQFPKT